MPEIWLSCEDATSCLFINDGASDVMFGCDESVDMFGCDGSVDTRKDECDADSNNVVSSIVSASWITSLPCWDEELPILMLLFLPRLEN